jgi:hypothetical protein
MEIRSRVLSSMDMAREAEVLLTRHHRTRQLPVPIERIIEFGLHLELVPCKGLFAEVKVDAFLTRDRRRIWVDWQQFVDNQSYLRFTFAEEVSHYWLHSEMLAALDIRTDADWFRARRLLSQDPRFERQAREMAGHLLVPARELRREAARAFRLASAHVRLGGQTGLDAMRLLAIEILARRFGVSEQVIEIRLDREGLIQDWPDVQGMVS